MIEHYRVIRSDRRSVSIEITVDGEVVVRAPRRLSDKQIRLFVDEKTAWIEKHLAKRRTQTVHPAFTDEQLQELCDRARQVIPTRVAHFAPLVGVTYERVTIRRQRTKWGSCSSKGNLNFNCLLMLVPPEVLDYVVVHELCHRKQLNHSAKFWVEVARVMPHYKECEAWLKDNGSALIARLITK